MSTALRDLLWSTRPLFVHYTGLTSAETGGTVRPVQYDDDAPTSLYAAATSLATLTQPQETSMTYDYDAHYHAMRGDHDPGPTLDQRRRDALRVDWLRVAVYSGGLIGCTVFWWAVVMVAKGWFS